MVVVVAFVVVMLVLVRLGRPADSCLRLFAAAELPCRAADDGAVGAVQKVAGAVCGGHVLQLDDRLQRRVIHSGRRLQHAAIQCRCQAGKSGRAGGGTA